MIQINWQKIVTSKALAVQKWEFLLFSIVINQYIIIVSCTYNICEQRFNKNNQQTIIMK